MQVQTNSLSFFGQLNCLVIVKTSFVVSLKLGNNFNLGQFIFVTCLSLSLNFKTAKQRLSDFHSAWRQQTMAQPSPSASGTSTPNPSVNLEALDFGHPTSIHPRPFKTPPTKARNPRRNKNLKQILQDEQKALAAAVAAETSADASNGTSSGKASVRGRPGKTLRVEGLQWSDIDAPPSLLPQKKYCDITGLEGKYTDPKTKLRFHNTEVYAVIQTLPASIDQEVCSGCKTFLIASTWR